MDEGASAGAQIVRRVLRPKIKKENDKPSNNMKKSKTKGKNLIIAKEAAAAVPKNVKKSSSLVQRKESKTVVPDESLTKRRKCRRPIVDENNPVAEVHAQSQTNNRKCRPPIVVESDSDDDLPLRYLAKPKGKAQRRIVDKVHVQPQAKKRKRQRKFVVQSDSDEEVPSRSRPNGRRGKKRKSQHINDNDIGNEVPVQVPPKKQKIKEKRSPIWIHFDEVVLTVNGVEGSYAQCKHCERKYKVSHKTNRSTGNMFRHMRREHSGLTAQQDGAFIFSQECFRKALLKWIIASSQPFSIVEEDEFIELIASLNPTADVISNKTVKADVMQAFMEKFELIKEEVKKVPGKISVTLDIWTSKNVIPFLAIRAHWISSEREYQTRLLDFAYVDGDHDGKTQCKLFLACMSRFEIPLSKVLAFTMDNNGNNDTLIECLRQHAIEIEVDLSSANNQVRCLAHVLNLSVQDILTSLGVQPVVNTEEEILDDLETDTGAELEDLEDDSAMENEEDEDEESEEVTGDIQPALKKLRKLVRKIRRSTKFRRKLKQLCDIYGVKALVPLIDVSTRWNSTFAMIKRGSHLKVPLRALCVEENSLASLHINESEWEQLRIVEVLLEKFDRATQLISMERHPTIASYIPTVTWLIEILESYVYDEFGALSYAARAGLEKLLKYEPHIKERKLPFIATMLNPALKLNYFKEQNVDSATINEIKETISEYFTTNYVNNFADNDDNNSEEIEDQFYAHMYKRSTTHSVSSELERYLSYPLSAPSPSNDLLQYWKGQQQEFPCLSLMARDIFAIQSTSTPVERDNSAGADIVTPTRCSLKAPAINASMCLKSWFKEFA